MKLSVVIPAYNEVATLPDILDAVRNSSVDDLQIIVVDDASNDGTTELLQGQLRQKVDTLVVHDRNKGKGAALKTGIGAAEGSRIIFQDADLEYDPAEYSTLLEALDRSGADVVFGSRFLGRGVSEVSPFWHRMVNGFLTLLSNFFTSYRLTDMETCYKMFPARFLKEVEFEESGFGIEPELTAKAAAAGLTIVEVPISYAQRDFDEGKKIRPSDGLRAIWVILKHGIRAWR